MFNNGIRQYSDYTENKVFYTNGFVIQALKPLRQTHEREPIRIQTR